MQQNRYTHKITLTISFTMLQLEIHNKVDEATHKHSYQGYRLRITFG